jgi:hypothetical protein
MGLPQGAHTVMERQRFRRNVLAEAGVTAVAGDAPADPMASVAKVVTVMATTSECRRCEIHLNLLIECSFVESVCAVSAPYQRLLTYLVSLFGLGRVELLAGTLGLSTVRLPLRPST